jgi:SAM-dependent methyltransferase
LIEASYRYSLISQKTLIVWKYIDRPQHSWFQFLKMASFVLLPATTYTPPPPVPAHRRRRSLNTIIEDEEDAPKGGIEAAEPQEQDESRLAKWLSPMSDHFPTPRARDETKKADWFSPMSDHFPTPRGNHFMSAPIVPASPSSATDSESEYSQVSSAPWNRDSFATQATDLGDIYDVSSDEEKNQKTSSRVGLSQTANKRRSTASKRVSSGSVAIRNSLPTLIIPDSDEKWGPPTFKFNSPIPPTPPPKLPMSPAVFQYLAAQEVLSSSATPSLDGSMSSEQMAAMSAPPTPNMDSDEREDGDNWGGVQLQPGALATLQALSGDDLYEQQTEQVIEVDQISPTTEMQQSPPPLVTSIRRHNSVVLPPEQQRSLNSLSKLEIPSPGGFFASLSPGSRYTWDVPAMKQEPELPPSSTTAEHFYKTPWTSTNNDKIVEVSEVLSDGCPTARPSLIAQSSDETIRGVTSPESSVEEEIIPTEILADYDDTYLRTLNDAASQNMDRTSMWLTAQTNYLSAVINPPEERDDENALEKRHTEVIAKDADISPSVGKKIVRFSAMDEIYTMSCPLPKLGRQESAYYRSFQNFSNRSRFRDIYVHRVPRFEALQTLRVSFPAAHRNYLLGKYQLSVVPMSEKKKRQSANVARGDETPEEDLDRLKSDKEYEAMEQMRFATWNVMALKLLNGGRLIAAPVAKRLARLSRMGPTATGKPRDRARILDLGGQATCDWAWHCATEYPNTKVYTVITKAIRQLSNSNIRGPKNHRQVAVEKLTKLPFNDNHFDVISARSLYAILKVSSENGEDEYDACLQECMRCLKPGGYLDFCLLDSDIVNAGPQGQAKSVEFGFSLKTRGYDPSPTKAWLGRLQKHGFVNIKRAWMFLPMGSPLQNSPVSRDSMGVELPLELEAMVTGSTNAAASITGLIGSWAWEKWMLKLEMECGKSEDSLLEGVYNIVEEGRKCGAGWRNLSGWARKPLMK